MEGFTIEVKARAQGGSSTCRRIRRDGLLPSVVYYSRGEKAYPVCVSTREFSKMARQARTSQVFTIKSDVSEIDGKHAIVKEIQVDNLSGDVLHVDFQALRENETVSVKVALKFVGEARGVKLDGGILTIINHEIKVNCLPKLIPSEIVVDVSDLALNHSIKVKDIKAPEGVKIEGNPEEAVVSVVLVHVTAEETAPAAGAAGEGAATAEGAAAPAAAGDKKAAEGAAAPEKKDAKAK